MRDPDQRTQLIGPSPECNTASLLLPSQPCSRLCPCEGPTEALGRLPSASLFFVLCDGGLLCCTLDRMRKLDCRYVCRPTRRPKHETGTGWHKSFSLIRARQA